MSEVRILLYHSVGEVDPGDELGIRVERGEFRRQMSAVKEGFEVVSLREAVDRIEGRKPARQDSVVITFDDGYRDNHDAAAPILEELGLSATFFMTTGYIGGVKTSPKRPWQRWDCMTREDLADLENKGHCIGSHAVRHLDLRELDRPAQREELRRSRELLGSLLKGEVEFFSYPYGYFNSGLERLAKEEGYRAACTTMGGVNTRDTGLYRLKRIEIRREFTIDDIREKLEG
jgi:peptidoglycan/xylan/chitin deacetylase (PgdA/CDA1 family)